MPKVENPADVDAAIALLRAHCETRAKETGTHQVIHIVACPHNLCGHVYQTGDEPPFADIGSGLGLVIAVLGGGLPPRRGGGH